MGLYRIRATYFRLGDNETITYIFIDKYLGGGWSVFSGRNPRVKKVLIREYNRYELTTIRLDEGRFLRPLTDPERVGGKICWSDFVMLTECAASTSAVVKHMD